MSHYTIPGKVNWVTMAIHRFMSIGVALAMVLSGPSSAFASGGGGSSASPSSNSSSSSSNSRAPSYTESYVTVDTLQVSIIQAAQVRGMLVISIGLDVQDSHLRERAEHIMPRLRDAYIQRLSRHGATRIDTRQVPNVAMLSGLLQSTTDEMLGEEGAEVLLMNVLVRSGVHHRGALGSQ